RRERFIVEKYQLPVCRRAEVGERVVEYSRGIRSLPYKRRIGETSPLPVEVDFIHLGIGRGSRRDLRILSRVGWNHLHVVHEGTIRSSRILRGDLNAKPERGIIDDGRSQGCSPRIVTS